MRTAYEWLREQYHWARDIGSWYLRGKPAPPPPWIKQHNLRNLAQKHQCRVFVETGTFHGSTIAALQNDFESVFSVEVSPALYEAACRKFSGAPNVKLLCGDSAVRLREILPSLTGPALFWLDAHYSGGVTGGREQVTAIRGELASVLEDRRFRHVLVIDDARDFGSGPYPSCEEIREIVDRSRPNEYVMSVVDDAIRLEPLAA